MLKVNEVILSDEPHRLLQYERGVFEVVSPSGERARVICPVNRSAMTHKWNGESANQNGGWWRIRKISET